MHTLDPKQVESALTQLFTHQLGLLSDSENRQREKRLLFDKRTDPILLAQENITHESLSLALSRTNHSFSFRGDA